MSTLTIDGGQLLLASEDERLISARLLPFGERCRSNLGAFTVDRGVLELPADASVAIMNDGHRREVPLAAGVLYAERDDGVHASWRVAKSPEGDAALRDIKDGKRTAVSVEAEVAVEAGRAVRGRIFGAALVSAGKQPAFQSALLLATAEDDVADPTDPTTEHYSNMWKDPATGETVESETTTTEEDEVDPDTGATTTTRTTTTVITTTPGTPAEQDPTVAVSPAPSTDPLLAQQPTPVPHTLLASRTGIVKPKPKVKPAAERTVNLETLLAMLAAAAPSHPRGAWDGRVLEQLRSPRVQGSFGTKRDLQTLLAELDDVVMDGAGAPNDMIVPQWIGELWSGRAYQSRWKPLFNSGTLTSPSVKGWRWVVEPVVGKWDGNKTAVPTGPVTTEPYDAEAQPFAMAHDVDRRYRDFGVTEFWDGYFRAGTESYAKQSDLYVPEVLFDPDNGATTAIAGGTVPAGVAPVMARIADGAIAVLDEDLPSFAAVTLADYRDLLLTRTEDNMAFLNAALGLEEGSIGANGNPFRVVPTSNAGLAGNKTLVGCKSAVTVHELPGSPIRIEGLDIAQGGIDPGLFGYEAVVIHNPKALALVTPHA